MINFASFFNQYRGSSNNLKELLDNSDTKIASLMEEESFISEFKSAAPRINLL